jgi:hypothetical protein
VGELMDVLREILLPKFSDLGPIRKTANGFDVCCPVHGDERPSLSIASGTTQPVVMDCKAGCETDDIIAKLGLTWADLCEPSPASPRGEWTPRGDAIAVYDYTDEAGSLLFQVCRTADKQFPQRTPDQSRKSGWRWSTEGVRRALYRLPKITEAVADGEVIFVCEGEKDVHAIEAAGAVATCNPGGAGKWRPEYADVLRDAVVRIVADRDKPGQAHARQVYASLEGIARVAEIVEAAGEGEDGKPLKDAADHLAAGYTLADFVITHAEDEPRPDLAPDLDEFLAGVDPPYAWVIESILERGDRLIWTGAEGLGKSVVGRQLAVAAAAGIHPFTNDRTDPRVVLWIDCENSERQGRRHFRRLRRVIIAKGCPVPKGGMRLIHRPEGIDLTRDEDVAWLMERVHAYKPELLYIGPLYRLHATDINDETAARKVTAVLDLARARADCALIIEGHSPHGGGGESRPVRPIGSSLFRRWPEFGYGISPATDDNPCKEVVIRPWRGARDERHWPRSLIWSEKDDEWPWVDPMTYTPRGGYGNAYNPAP